MVKGAVKTLLHDRRTMAIVASAACGADILALEAARELGLRTRIVLPFERTRFRRTSVIDRGGEWGPRFDAIIDDADARQDLIVLMPANGNDDMAYAAATARIIDETVVLGRAYGAVPIALAIWDEKPRATVDATKEFVDQVARAGIELCSIPTCTT